MYFHKNKERLVLRARDVNIDSSPTSKAVIHQLHLGFPMTRFANAYWSADYRSGIELLSQQLLDSLGQLHELRKFIFNHMNYHHSNSEYLAKLSKDSLPIESRFRKAETGKRIFSGTRRTLSEQTPEQVDVKYVFKEFVDRTALELQRELNLASEIETQILGKITGFIKIHEPQIKLTLERFEDLLEAYDEARRKMERTKGKYDEMVRLGEIEGLDHRVCHEPIETTSPEPKTPEKNNRIIEHDEEHPEPSLPELDLSFPLLLGGGLRFETKDRLQSFLSDAIANIKTIRRKIPFPGYRNEIFESDQLCEYLKTHRPHGFNPTRSALEKLGQSLIDRKIIVGTGIFSHKFKSEGMWFEWSQEAINFSEYKNALSSSSSSSTAVSLPTFLKISQLSIDESSRKVNEVAETTSKKFNLMFKNVKSSFMKPKYSEEAIQELESEYNEAYEDAQRNKHLLDMEILQKSQVFERFEMVRIEVIYQSLTKLLEVLYKDSTSNTTSLHDFTSTFIEKFNKPQNYETDLKKLITSNSTGIYFPAIILPQNKSGDHFDPTRSNTSFQNMRFKFNLYKDIPLQIKNADIEADSLMCTRSLPVLLKNLVEITFLAEKTELKELWTTPINHKEYWILKHEVIELIQQFKPSDELNLQDEKAIEIAIVKKVVERLSKTSTSRIINFLRNWLLETSDSVIPCTVYESLLTLHTKKDGDDTQLDDVIKILSAIPRSNLSSLIFILENICFIYDLEATDGYGSTDEVTEHKHEKADVTELVEKLNSTQAIGSVPFLHLIFRPSVGKYSTGFKPPMEAYNAFLQNLLDASVREKLCMALVANENNFVERTKRQEQNLGINKKAGARVPSKESPPRGAPSVNVGPSSPGILSNTLSSPTPKTPTNALTGDQFSLRPFRTGTTPRPSPISSPVHSKRMSSDRTRNRSDSGHLLSIDKEDNDEVS